METEIPIKQCSLMLKGPGFKEKANPPRETDLEGKILAKNFPIAYEAKLTKKMEKEPEVER